MVVWMVHPTPLVEPLPIEKAGMLEKNDPVTRSDLRRVEAPGLRSKREAKPDLEVEWADPVIPNLPVERRDHRYLVSQRCQGRWKRFCHIGQAAGLGERGHLGGEVENIHGVKMPAKWGNGSTTEIRKRAGRVLGNLNRYESGPNRAIFRPLCPSGESLPR